MRTALCVGRHRSRPVCGSGAAKFLVLLAVGALAIPAGVHGADKRYGPGVTDTEIKIGQTVPYSGPASAFSSYGRVMTGYFRC